MVTWIRAGATRYDDVGKLAPQRAPHPPLQAFWGLQIRAEDYPLDLT